MRRDFLDRSHPPLRETIADFARSERGRRTIGIVVALLLEGLLLLALLSLGIVDEREPVPMAEIATFDVRDANQPVPEPEDEPEQRRSALEPEPRPREVPEPLPTPEPVPMRPPVVEVPEAPSTPRPSATVAPGRAYGPPAPSSQRDSARVGTAPNGQPLYAAAWYRRPRDEEMRGYLSTATAGYATISCRTVPDFRVEDCTLEDEFPAGSQMGRAVMAMAWQFRVRPPMIGGQYQVGEWVRIRIYYDVRTDRFDYGG